MSRPLVPPAAQKLDAAGWLLAISAFVGAIAPLVMKAPAYFEELMKMYRAFGFNDAEAIAHIRQSEADVHAFDDWLQASGYPVKHPDSKIPE